MQRLKNTARTLTWHFSQTLLSQFRPANVAMFHIGRCGSTVVGQLLQQHSQIYWGKEIYEPLFQKLRSAGRNPSELGENPKYALKLLREQMLAAGRRIYGVEIKPFHLTLLGYSPESFIHQLHILGFTHYIILDRRNRLRKILSSLKAQTSGKYHVRSGHQAGVMKIRVGVESVTIDYASKPLLELLAGYEEQMATLRKLLDGEKRLDLSYEDHVEHDPKIAYQYICGFLGVKPEDPIIKLSKTNPFTPSESIENLDEVSAALKGTPYEWMLVD
ncbi:MAG: hypothetical protein IGQ88_01045 [Gloeomargaritaceae cyanobacterium C42_A2020_066]|nr:hypothetical protein [Gloeomargaritaceae cyanobacterium C42_A2020_066]